MESFLQFYLIENKENEIKVAILILLESFLQYTPGEVASTRVPSRNPYFIGILSAIRLLDFVSFNVDVVAILILLESFLQFSAT